MDPTTRGSKKFPQKHSKNMLLLDFTEHDTNVKQRGSEHLVLAGRSESLGSGRLGLPLDPLRRLKYSMTIWPVICDLIRNREELMKVQLEATPKSEQLREVIFILLF
ncbi:hypothetical protein ACQJBY_017613 [Aegilops geniculata]